MIRVCHGHPLWRLAPLAPGEDNHHQQQQHGQHYPVDQVTSPVTLVLPVPRAAYRVKDEVPDGQPAPGCGRRPTGDGQASRRRSRRASSPSYPSLTPCYVPAIESDCLPRGMSGAATNAPLDLLREVPVQPPTAVLANPLPHEDRACFAAGLALNALYDVDNHCFVARLQDVLDVSSPPPRKRRANEEAPALSRAFRTECYPAFLAAISQMWPPGSRKLAVRIPHGRSIGPFSSSTPRVVSSRHISSTSSTSRVN